MNVVQQLDNLELELEPADVFAPVSEEEYQKIMDRFSEKLASDMMENEIQAAKSLEYAAKSIALI